MKVVFSVIVAGIFTTVFSASELTDSKPHFMDHPNMNVLPLAIISCFDININWVRLMDFASSSQENQEIVATILRQQFQKAKLEISGKKYSKELAEFDALLQALRSFGHLVTKLKIDYASFDQYQCETLNKHLNSYCSDSMIEMEFINSDDRTMSELQGPFTKANYVRINLNSAQTNESVRYNEMFPAVERLIQDGLAPRIPKRLSYHFPHLRETTIESELVRNEFWPTLELRLELNPQLRHVTFDLSNWHVLRIISEKRPQIESVVLKRFNNMQFYNGSDIQLLGLKVFRMQQKWTGRLERIPLIFGNLEEIECYEPVNMWFDIIIQNKKLKKVKTGELSDGQLFRLIEELPNLEEFVTDHKISGSSDKIVNFIKRGIHLKRVQFTQSEFETSKAAVKQVNDSWRLGGADIFVKE